MVAAARAGTSPGEDPVIERLRCAFAVYNAAGVGAVYEVARKQARRLAAEGHEVTVISDRSSDWGGLPCAVVAPVRSRAQGLFVRATEAATARMPVVLQRRFGMAGLLSQYLLGHAVAEHVRAGDKPFDVVITNQHFLFFGLRTLERERLVINALGDIFEHPADAFSLPYRHFYRAAAAAAYRRADLVVACSEALAARAAEHGARRTQVIPNSMDTRALRGGAAAPRGAGVGLRCLFVGRIAREKGLDVAIRAMARLDPSASLTIVGDGPEAPVCRALAAGLDLGERVTFLGRVDAAGLRAAYAEADLLVLPSRSDAFPLVAIEGCAAGLAVVASRVGGIPDIIVDGGCGLLVDPDDEVALAEALGTLAGDRARLAKLSAGALLRATDFDDDRVLPAFGACIRALCEEAAA